MSARVDYHFGELAGQPVGFAYVDRKEAMRAGAHDNWVPGISGQPDQGADCVALNGGYIDDEDHGGWILYTGAGGKSPSSKRQIADQQLSQHHNAALVYSEENGLPIRVLRGPKGEKPYAPKAGYRYDGLYKVARHWAEEGRDGFRIWRFHLVRLTSHEARPWTPDGQVRSSSALPQDHDQVPEGSAEPGRVEGIVQRIVRSTRVSRYVKELHRHRCQICRTELSLPVGQYSEGAHIRGVGAPHNGPDTPDNVLCLCPNDHVLFDKGALYLDDDLEVFRHDGAKIGRLTTHDQHTLSLEHIRYHREHHGFTVATTPTPFR